MSSPQTLVSSQKCLSEFFMSKETALTLILAQFLVVVIVLKVCVWIKFRCKTLNVKYNLVFKQMKYLLSLHLYLLMLANSC